VLDSNDGVQIIDVRPKTEFGICQLPGSISEFNCCNPSRHANTRTDIPLNDLVADPASYFPSESEAKSTYVVCRLGNDSQIAADALRGQLSRVNIIDLIGGLKAWTKHVDPNFPVY
jgi:adenylyltransferase/sulfurtransferase